MNTLVKNFRDPIWNEAVITGLCLLIFGGGVLSIIICDYDGQIIINKETLVHSVYFFACIFIIALITSLAIFIFARKKFHGLRPTLVFFVAMPILLTIIYILILITNM